MKICYIDVETTGLDPETNSIVQCSGIIEVDGEERERFNLDIRPRAVTRADPEALKIIGKTEEELRAYPPSEEQYVVLSKILARQVSKFNRQDKLFFAAYNAHFDMQFMRKWWEAMGDKYFGSYFFFPPLDVMVIAGHYLMRTRHEFQNFRLETVCLGLGMDWDAEAAHDAMYDVEKTKALYERLAILSE